MALRRGRVILAIALVLLGLSVWRTMSLQSAHQKLSTSYEEARQALMSLQSERARLSQELAQAKQTVSEKTEDLSGLEQELGTVKAQLDQTLTELTGLQQEHARLQQTASTMQSRLEATETAKRQLEAKLSDIKQLKLAMRDVRRKIWSERWASWRSRALVSRSADRELAAGNRGYVVRQGVSTLGTKTQLRVQVLDVQPQ